MLLGVMNSSICGETVEFLADILAAIDKAVTYQNDGLSFEGYSQKDGKLYLHNYKSSSYSKSSEEQYGQFVEWKMKKPESIAHFLYTWLENQEYDPIDFDGSVHEGWRLNIGSIGWTAIDMWIEPTYILYGK